MPPQRGVVRLAISLPNAFPVTTGHTMPAVVDDHEFVLIPMRAQECIESVLQGERRAFDAWKMPFPDIIVKFTFTNFSQYVNVILYLQVILFPAQQQYVNASVRGKVPRESVVQSLLEVSGERCQAADFHWIRIL